MYVSAMGLEGGARKGRVRVCVSAMRGEAGRVCVARGRACVESEVRRGRVHVCVCVSELRIEGVCVWRGECEVWRGECEAW